MQSRRIWLKFSLVVLALSIAGPATAGVDYNALADFSATNNPNGVWSYGSYATGGVNPATLAIFATESNTFAPPLEVWYNSPNGSPDGIDPNVIYNPSASSYDGFIPGNSLTLGPYGGPVVVSFTVPTTGLYTTDATFTQTQSGNTTAGAYVFVYNPATLMATGGYIGLAGSPTITGPGQAGVAATYSSSLSLVAGERIDFVLAGSENGYGNATTQLSANITSTPEPTSVVVWGLAIASSLAAAARCRRTQT